MKQMTKGASWMLYNGIMHVPALMLALVIFMFSGCVVVGLSSCKSVSKTQANKTESTAVSKSDSSSVKTHTVIDTTKTDSSTEITTYTITADSVDFYNYIPKGDITYNGEYVPTTYGTPTAKFSLKSAKGVKITSTTKTQKAIVNKGESTKEVNQQTDVTSDSTVAKKETLNETTKTAHPIKIIIGIGLLLLVIAGAIYLYLKK